MSDHDDLQCDPEHHILLQVLGCGDFYYELGVQIVEACLATQPLNGGLMEINPLMHFVNVSSGFLLLHSCGPITLCKPIMHAYSYIMGKIHTLCVAVSSVSR